MRQALTIILLIPIALLAVVCFKKFSGLNLRGSLGKLTGPITSIKGKIPFATYLTSKGVIFIIGWIIVTVLIREYAPSSISGWILEHQLVFWLIQIGIFVLIISNTKQSTCNGATTTTGTGTTTPAKSAPPASKGSGKVGDFAKSVLSLGFAVVVLIVAFRWALLPVPPIVYRIEGSTNPPEEWVTLPYILAPAGTMDTPQTNRSVSVSAIDRDGHKIDTVWETIDPRVEVGLFTNVGSQPVGTNDTVSLPSATHFEWVSLTNAVNTNVTYIRVKQRKQR